MKKKKKKKKKKALERSGNFRWGSTPHEARLVLPALAKCTSGERDKNQRKVGGHTYNTSVDEQ